MMGSPDTVRNLERKSCKTVFLGSQPFWFEKSLPVIQREPRTITAFRRVLGDVGVSPRYRNKQASTGRSRSASVSVFHLVHPVINALQVTCNAESFPMPRSWILT